MAAGDITILLDRWRGGDRSAVDELTPLVYGQLRTVALSYLRREWSGHTIDPTGLVNELFLVLLREQKARFDDRAHFFAFCARAMRRILVDQARMRDAAKRGAGEAPVELLPEIAWVDPAGPEMLDLDRALDELEALDARKARAVELRVFLGCSAVEAAELMGISKPTLDRDLRFALAWLYERMNPQAE